MNTGLDHYVEQINKLKLLTRDEEFALVRRYQRGDKVAGDRLINCNLRFALKVAHEFQRRYRQPIDDLVQVANEGLLRARETFDPGRGYRFCTYAVHWIKARLRMYCTHNVSVVRFGTTNVQRMLFARLRYTFSVYQQEHPDETDSQILKRCSRKLHVSAEECESVYSRLSGGDASLNRRVDHDLGGGAATFLDLIEDPSPQADEKVIEQECRQMMRQAAYDAARSPRERYIIDKRMFSPAPMTLQAIADRFGLSRERTRQIEESIIERMTAAL